MLAKQVWRLITNTNSLMVRTLKQKYFPHTELMETKVPPTASYTWKSILSARDVVRLGACKLVGSGSSINIWSDPWVPNLPNFKVLPRAQIDPAGPNYVHELRLEGEWNYQLIDITFVEWEAREIKKIPLSAFPQMNRWTWQLTKTGDFTVKSAYFAFLHSVQAAGTSSSNNPCNDIWKVLWNANVPPKVKNFGWRALHGGLPVRSKLKKRGIVMMMLVCLVCGENAETIMHSLFFCPVAKSIWYFSPLRLTIDAENSISFNSFCQQKMKEKKKREWWDILWSLLWGIWLKRNSWCFDKKSFTIEYVIQQAVNLVGEFIKANEARATPFTQNTVTEQGWKMPPAGVCKINSDVACFSDKTTGLGGVVRDCLGDVLLSTSWRLQEEFEVDIGEALAARHLLTISTKAGFRSIILETDNLKLHQHLKHRKIQNSRFGLIISDILKLADSCSSFASSHVGRKGNGVAHRLAQISVMFEDMRIWMEEVPECASDAVIFDVLSN